MRTMFVCLSIAAVAAISGCGPAGNPQAEAAAAAAALDWLSLVDEGKYAESWEAAASFFRDAVDREEWNLTMESLRTPFGAKISRDLRSRRYQTDLPGAPRGEYVVIEFEAAFEHKESVIETVTPMLDTDGQWRVSGYFMR